MDTKNISLLDKNLASEVIHQGLLQGADFVDIFVEESQNQSIEFESKKVSQIQSGIDFGVGIRIIYGKNSIYSYTNSTKKEDLLKLVQDMKKEEIKNSSSLPTPHKSFTPQSHSIAHYPLKKPSLKEQVSFLSKIDQDVRLKSEKIIQSSVTCALKEQYIEIFNSEGLHLQDFRPYSRLYLRAIAQDGIQRSRSHQNPGSRGGWGFFETLNTQELTDKVSRQALTMLQAKPCPAGTFPVVIAGGFGGVIFHEACGHPLETTSVEKKSSVFWDKMDSHIAHPAVNAVDDGTIDNAWGSLTYDDEGMPTQKTQLIKNGMLTGFLVDKMGEIRTGYKRTGSGRKESYKFSPASRMRNTYIEAGPHTLDELISSIDDGIYAADMGGGSVNPGTGEFNFAVLEAYRIKNGKLTDPIKGASLIGRGYEILKNISMVGKDLSLSAGMCGSVSGAVPVTVGQPSLKVDQILVGGQ